MKKIGFMVYTSIFKIFTLFFLFANIFVANESFAVTGVNPTGVNVNHTGVNTVFLTFQNLGPNEQVLESFWCGEVVATGVSSFNPCVSGTVLGVLPARNNLSRPSGTGGVNNLTDIMTIPASVTRRAFQQSQAGENATFFYVRRFSNGGGSGTDVLGGIGDTYVTVTCRMAGGGARSPLALTDVRVEFKTEEGLRPVYFLGRNETAPSVMAKIKYNGTGRLKGRWEVVMPGDPEPKDVDLLTEATLPVEQRASQRRYSLVSRFDVFLPPTGEVELPGPDPLYIPTQVDGPYKMLLRIEASAEKEGNSNTLDGNVVSGGVAGFPMPVLRYYVGKADALQSMKQNEGSIGVTLLTPASEQSISMGDGLMFTWQGIKTIKLYELEVQANEETVLNAIIKGSVTKYKAPPFLNQHADKELRWRVKVIDIGGDIKGVTSWRKFSLEDKTL